jgi:hypothetical protein
MANADPNTTRGSSRNFFGWRNMITRNPRRVHAMMIGDNECPVSRNTAAVKNSSRPAGGRTTSAIPIGNPLSSHNHPTKRRMFIK